MAEQLTNVAEIDSKSIRTLATGALRIKGIGANFDVDKEDEFFHENAFTKGLKRFMAQPARPLLHNHLTHEPLGRVISAEVVRGVGVVVEAEVDYHPPGSKFHHLYLGIKSGAIRSLSVGGLFKKVGNKIVECQPVEWSVCAVSIGNGTNLEIIEEGKSIMSVDMKALSNELHELSGVLDDMNDALRKPAGFSVGVTRQARANLAAAEREEHRKAVLSDYVPPAIPDDAQQRWDEHRRDVMRKRYDAVEEARRNGEDEPVWFEDPPVNVPRWWALPDRAVTHTFRPSSDALADGEVRVRDGWNADGTVIAPTDPSELEFTAEETFALDGPDRESIIEKGRRRFVEKFLKQKVAYDDVDLVPVVIREQSAEQQLAAFAVANPTTNAGRAEWQRRSDDLDMEGLAHVD